MTDKPKQPYRHWTPEEDEILREYYTRPLLCEIAKQMDRSERSLYMRAFQLGLTRKQDGRWKRRKEL